ncbi:MAG: SPOR domain-containing protein [Phenylobacterium sp.]|uniref:surface-adhesin E family protein n=1 Tax=Phenylobacterium sp. TaxID=1871053 RepID=UPI00273333D5|nr:surface-adhesin E family protein [Phenylobacterium sp.]MDP3176046.1 SPOR domain-containing protein [Phenylobacterium sp.]
MNARAIAAAMICGLAAAHAAFAQPAASFPPASDAESLAVWLLANTDLAPAAVVSIGRTSVIGLRSVALPVSAGAGLFDVHIRSEVIDAETASEGGYLSWSADVEVDCAGRRSRATTITNYPQRNLRGAGREGSESGEWVSPTAGTRLYSVIQAVCDPNFRRPLAGLPRPKTKPVVVAAAPTAAAAKAKPPAAKPPAPAAVKPRTGNSPSAVQLSASGSAVQARQSITRIRRAFAVQTTGLLDTVEEATVSGKPVYRALLYGFASRGQAVSLCSVLSAKGHACFVKERATR